MAEKKTAVFLRGENGKPYAAATFTDFGDAQQYYQRRRRAGEEAYIADEDASPKVVSRHFPPKTDRIARNQAFAARMANAKAQVIDEEIGEAARAEAKATTDVKPMRAAAREEAKANKDAAKEGESTTEAKSSSSGSGQ